MPTPASHRLWCMHAVLTPFASFRKLPTTNLFLPFEPDFEPDFPPFPASFLFPSAPPLVLLLLRPLFLGLRVVWVWVCACGWGMHAVLQPTALFSSVSCSGSAGRSRWSSPRTSSRTTATGGLGLAFSPTSSHRTSSLGLGMPQTLRDSGAIAGTKNRTTPLGPTVSASSEPRFTPIYSVWLGIGRLGRFHVKRLH